MRGEERKMRREMRKREREGEGDKKEREKGVIHRWKARGDGGVSRSRANSSHGCESGEFGRVGGPANNAGLVFLNPRTNRHLSGERDGGSLGALHSSRCSRAHLSLFPLFYSAEEASENDLTVPGARASGRPATAHADPLQ